MTLVLKKEYYIQSKYNMVADLIRENKDISEWDQEKIRARGKIFATDFYKKLVELVNSIA